MPEYRVLGPLEVLAAEGRPLALGGQKQRALLALLLLRANRVVSSDVLIESLWGADPPRSALASLQNSVSALRKLLGTDAVETRPRGYRLVVEEESLDLARFERLVESARTLEPVERAGRLRQALALWRGDPLGDLELDTPAASEVRRLEELRLAVLEDRLDADLACGRYAEVVPELEALVAREPLRERLRAQLMTALYHSGRQADALQAFQDARHRLVEELGIEPGPLLQELHQRVLRQELPSPVSAETAAGDDHFAEVVEALRTGRLVPVLGLDVGELAAELARRFDVRDGHEDLAHVAQFVALTKGTGPLHDELRALLAAKAAPTPVHRFFASLPSRLRADRLPQPLLVTTGYDLALEQALLEAGEEFDVVSYVASGRDRGRFCHRDPTGSTRVIDVPNTYATELPLEERTVVLKLDGGLAGRGESDSFVVTEDDFIGYLSHGDVAGAVPVRLAARLRHSHFLFLGFGMREWSLRLLLDRLWAGEPLAYRSWAIVPCARPLERQFWRARDVELLEQRLDEYVGALERHLGAAAAEAVA